MKKMKIDSKKIAMEKIEKIICKLNYKTELNNFEISEIENDLLKIFIDGMNYMRENIEEDKKL